MNREALLDPVRLRRFWSKVQLSPGCWEWIGARTAGGYGNFCLRAPTNARAHRLSYEMSFGPIPEGLHIDHLCRNRSCVRPTHLEAVTQAENNRRAVRPLDMCRSGLHSMTEALTSPKGRYCGMCHARNRRKRRGVARAAGR